MRPSSRPINIIDVRHRGIAVRRLLGRFLTGLVVWAALTGNPAPAQDAGEDVRRQVLLTDVSGAIGPPVTRQIAGLIEEGEARDAEAVIVRLDTPGGLSTSTREITQAILGAEVPVIVHVAPPGARAASAGTYILYASHVAAMAPGTNLGAATPVRLGGDGPPGLPGSDGDGADGRKAPASEDGPGGQEEREQGSRPSSADRMSRKVINDAVAHLRSLAELRGRNADWAEESVREGASLSAKGALEKGVIEFLAESSEELLLAIDGHEVDVGGESVSLDTAGARLEEIEPSLVTQLLRVLSNPNVALLLMTLGFYGLVFELANPGLGPGIPGIISLVLGLYLLNLLPLNYAGLALIGLGLALMTAEAVTPTFGVLGVGGAVAFAIGAVMLIDTDVPAYQISRGAIVGITLMSLAVLMLVVGTIFRTRRRREHTSAGARGMVGETGRVEAWEGREGHVRTHGERWRAYGPPDLAIGERVEITDVQGLELTVARPAVGEPREKTT